MANFNIIEYLSGMTNYYFDKSVLNRIALEREVTEVTSYSSLDKKTKELLLADLLYVIYISPDTTASLTIKDGSFSKTIGSQVVQSKQRLYEIIKNIYETNGDTTIIDAGSGKDEPQKGGTVGWITEID